MIGTVGTGYVLLRPSHSTPRGVVLLRGLPQRRAMGLGVPMTSAEVDAWAHDVVNLFLNGCRRWERATTRQYLAP